MNFSADFSPLVDLYRRRKALDDLLSQEGLGDYAHTLSPGARDSVTDGLRDRLPTDEIVAELRNEYDLSPENELQARLRLEENRQNVDDIMKAKALGDAGLDTTLKELAQGRLLRAAERLSPAQQVDAANEHSVAPYDMNGGALYDKYGGNIVDEHSALRAQAMQRLFAAEENRANAEGQQWENAAMRKSYGDLTDPLLRADFLNDKEIADAEPEIVKVINPETGKAEHRTARRTADGSYRADRIRGGRGEGIRLAEEPKDDNTRQVKAPITVWRQAVTDALRELKQEPRFRNRVVDNQTLESRALEIYRLLQNDPAASPPASARARDIVEDLNARNGGEAPAGDDAESRVSTPQGESRVEGTDQPVTGPLSQLSLQQWTYLKQARRAIDGQRKDGQRKDPGAVRALLDELGVNPALLDLLPPTRER